MRRVIATLVAAALAVLGMTALTQGTAGATTYNPRTCYGPDPGMANVVTDINVPCGGTPYPTFQPFDDTQDAAFGVLNDTEQQNPTLFVNAYGAPLDPSCFGAGAQEMEAVVPYSQLSAAEAALTAGGVTWEYSHSGACPSTLYTVNVTTNPGTLPTIAQVAADASAILDKPYAKNNIVDASIDVNGDITATSISMSDQLRTKVHNDYPEVSLVYDPAADDVQTSSRGGDSSPFYMGDYVCGVNANMQYSPCGGCTMGLPWVKNNARWIATAGHCWENGTAYTGCEFVLSRTLDCGRLYYSYYMLGAATHTYDVSLLQPQYNRAGTYTGNTVTNKLWNSGTFSGTSTYTIGGAGSNYAGKTVVTDGAKTLYGSACCNGGGSAAWTISSTNSCYINSTALGGDGSKVCGMVRADKANGNCLVKGDSGGPVGFHASNGYWYGNGIISGGGGGGGDDYIPPNSFEDLAGQCSLYFTSTASITAQLGGTILSSP